MGLLEFDKLPINPLVGADRKTFESITKGYTIDKPYRGKYRLTRMISALLGTLKPIQDRRYRRLLEQYELELPPVFILGHWRSGTTFVHNVLANDPHFGYNTTYQTVFPHLMMWGQSMFKPTMKWLMPDKRPTDNMELSPDLPQEEEFALCNMMPYTYYNFWYLPRDIRDYCDKYLLFNDITPEEKQVFKDTFLKLIKISLWNTGGTQFLSKNPPHTGRVSALLEMFPDAKFIYLMRNPYTVFESTRSFFNNTIRPLKLQEADPDFIEKNILEVYTKLYKKYESEKTLIPTENLYEIKFEDFESAPYESTEEIYRKLEIPGLGQAKDRIKEYLEDKKGYTKNKYGYEQRTLDLVRENWNYAFEDWGYEV